MLKLFSAAGRALLRPQPIINFDQAEPSRAWSLLPDPKPFIDFLQRPDGVALRYAVYEPPASARSGGAILMIPGKGGVIEDFDPYARIHAAKGDCVFVYDPRGAGLSGRSAPNLQTVHVANADQPVDDLVAILHAVVRPRQKGRLLIVAHSYGAAIATLGLGEQKIACDGQQLLAPMIRALRLPEGLRGACVAGLARFGDWRGKGAAYFPGNGDCAMGTHTRDDNPKTFDAEAFDRWAASRTADPRLLTHGPSNSWIKTYYEIRRRLSQLPKGAIGVPTQIILASDESYVDNSSTRNYAQRGVFSSHDIQVLDGSKHDLMRASEEQLHKMAESLRRMDNPEHRARRPAGKPLTAPAERNCCP